jgi:GT2 family glycosyltransferase
MIDKVSVVTVTYGKRWILLREVLSSVIDNELVNDIIVVNNNADDQINPLCKNLSNKITVINLNENTGSANGFHIGISEAVKKDNQYIWLLDDDNKPNNNALENLVDNTQKLQSQDQDKGVWGISSLRNDRKELIQAANNFKPKDIFPSENSFLGFHILQIPSKILKKVFKKNYSGKRITNKELVQIPLAPYGGFFFNKNLISKIGLPNKDFYLYSDDYEFTHRVNTHGGNLYLDPNSIVEDLEQSWFVETKQPYILSLITSSKVNRIYYGIRNRVYFENKNLVNNFKIYKINKFFFLLIINILSMFLVKRERKRLIMRAIRDGENENLGKVDFL